MGANEGHEVVVIGAGAAGLGVAVALQRRGIDDVIVLERAGSVGSSWGGRYDGLQPEHGAGPLGPGAQPIPERWDLAVPRGVHLLSRKCRGAQAARRAPRGRSRSHRSRRRELEAADLCGDTGTHVPWSSRLATTACRGCRTGRGVTRSRASCCTAPPFATCTPIAAGTCSSSAPATPAARSRRGCADGAARVRVSSALL